jgi:hypothetical protein
MFARLSEVANLSRERERREAKQIELKAFFFYCLYGLKSCNCVNYPHLTFSPLADLLALDCVCLRTSFPRSYLPNLQTYEAVVGILGSDYSFLPSFLPSFVGSKHTHSCLPNIAPLLISLSYGNIMSLQEFT